MDEPSFGDQPKGVKAAVALALMNTFVLVEELVIDRGGLSHYLPFYRLGNFCPYDAIALAAILLGVFWSPSRCEVCGAIA